MRSSMLFTPAYVASKQITYFVILFPGAYALSPISSSAPQSALDSQAAEFACDISVFAFTIEPLQMEYYSKMRHFEGVHMLGGRKIWALLLCCCLLFIAALPAMAADPEITKEDLKGISPQRHKYLFSVVGGAAIGAGIGVLVGGGGDVVKGMMVGGGGMSAYYLHTHRRDNMGGWRNWAYVGSYTALGGGLGWTICGCDDGLVSGLLIGGGGTTAWLAAHPQRTSTTATTPKNP
jgi:hypothetical protein